jgi:hypothetical protein
LLGIGQISIGGYPLLNWILGVNAIQSRQKVKAFARAKMVHFVYSYFSSLNQNMYRTRGRCYPDNLLKDFAKIFVDGISPYPGDRPSAQFMVQKVNQWRTQLAANI